MAEFKSEVLRPEDTLVVTVTEPTALDRISQVRDALEAQGVKYLILAGEGLQIGVRKPSDSGRA